MKYASLAAAGAVVLLANAFALAHAARNRSGEPGGGIVMTDRELTCYCSGDDSGVSLQLRWVDPGTPRYSTAVKAEDLEAGIWLNRAKLVELGFDCGVDPATPQAYSFYSRQGARSAFVAFEYNGPAWQRWIERELRIAQAGQAMIAGQKSTVDYQRRQSSQLAAIDAARDSAVLRSRYPDQSRVLIVPAVIRVALSTSVNPRLAYISGYIQETPSAIHVPRPFSDGFRAPGQKLFRDEKREDPLYRVRLRYGKLLEPWVTAVEFVP